MALVLVGTLGVIPALAWLAHRAWGILGRDPDTAYAVYYAGVLLGWAGFALVVK